MFQIVPDLDAADLKFRAGELHGLDDVKPENYNWYKDNQQKNNFTLHDLGPDLNTNHFWFNLNKVQKPTPGKKLGEPFVGCGQVRVVQQPDVPPRGLAGHRPRGDDPVRVLRRGRQELGHRDPGQQSLALVRIC